MIDYQYRLSVQVISILLAMPMELRRELLHAVHGVIQQEWFSSYLLVEFCVSPLDIFISVQYCSASLLIYLLHYLVLFSGAVVIVIVSDNPG